MLAKSMGLNQKFAAKYCIRPYLVPCILVCLQANLEAFVSNFLNRVQKSLVAAVERINDSLGRVARKCLVVLPADKPALAAQYTN